MNSIAGQGAEPSAEGESIHDFFGLSYANYLVLPRSLLQSCSPATQQALTSALILVRAEERANREAHWPGDLHIRVQLQDPESGRFLKDDLANYERGRRRLWEQRSE